MGGIYAPGTWDGAGPVEEECREISGAQAPGFFRTLSLRGIGLVDIH